MPTLGSWSAGLCRSCKSATTRQTLVKAFLCDERETLLRSNDEARFDCNSCENIVYFKELTTRSFGRDFHFLAPLRQHGAKILDIATRLFVDFLNSRRMNAAVGAMRRVKVSIAISRLMASKALTITAFKGVVNDSVDAGSHVQTAPDIPGLHDR